MVYQHSSNVFSSLLTYSGTIQPDSDIAVVFVNKTPTLYINGVQVATGIQSDERQFELQSDTLASRRWWRLLRRWPLLQRYAVRLSRLELIARRNDYQQQSNDGDCDWYARLVSQHDRHVDQ